MDNDEKDIEIYSTRVCKFCTLGTDCNKAKFKVTRYGDKTNMHCAYYEYINKED